MTEEACSGASEDEGFLMEWELLLIIKGEGRGPLMRSLDECWKPWKLEEAGGGLIFLVMTEIEC